MASGSLIPGFRFHPTDVELVMFYLKRKLLGKKITVKAVAEVNIYDFSPWDLPDKSDLKGGDLEWYFFCPNAKKYSCGDRSNRATEVGFWKATGKDRVVEYNGRTVATIKTLVFHLGHKGKGERTDWVMHEYKMKDEQLARDGIVQDAYVLCKVFKKSGLGPKNGAQYGAQFNEEEWDGDFQMTVDPVGVTVSAANTVTEKGSTSRVSSDNNNQTENALFSANTCASTLSLAAPQNTHVTEQLHVTETPSDMVDNDIDDFIFFEDFDLLMAFKDEAAVNMEKASTTPTEDDIYKDLANLIDVKDLKEADFTTVGADYTLDELTSLDELEHFYVE